MKRLLDLYCGGGGAAVGYNRAGFKVIGVDIKPQPHYPFPFILGDAIDVLKRMLNGEKFLASDGNWYGIGDFAGIHASPPCQKFTGLQDVNRVRWGDTKNHPDLIDLTRRVLIETGKPYVIENVQKAPLQTQIILCGVSMGLPHIQRHRHFESNILLYQTKCRHREQTGEIIGVYGKLDGRKISFKKEYPDTYAASSIEQARELLGIDWMDDGEIQEAIPPVYTEYIGRQLMQYLHAGVTS